MDTIGSKATVRQLTAPLAEMIPHNDADEIVQYIQSAILEKKIRYPLLEFAGMEIYNVYPEKRQVELLDKIMALQTNGGSVLAGIILQKRLSEHFLESIAKAMEYIIAGNDWLVCDTIGERVTGFALLTMPELTIPVLKEMAGHENKWVVRCIGVATHLAVKKGLLKKHVDEMFQLLLSLSNTTNFHTKKGIGWAAKTIAKFHPEIIERYADKIDNDPDVKQWFKTKIKIGLGRTYKYAHRYTS